MGKYHQSGDCSNNLCRKEKTIKWFFFFFFFLKINVKFILKDQNTVKENLDENNADLRTELLIEKNKNIELEKQVALEKERQSKDEKLIYQQFQKENKAIEKEKLEELELEKKFEEEKAKEESQIADLKTVVERLMNKLKK